MARARQQDGDEGGLPPIPTDQLLDIRQVCQLAGGVSPASVRRAVKNGQFPAPVAVFGLAQLQRWCPIAARRALGLPVPGEAKPGRGR